MNRRAWSLVVGALIGCMSPPAQAQAPLTLYCTDNRDGTVTCQDTVPLSPLTCSRNPGGTLSCRGASDQRFTCITCAGDVIVCCPNDNGSPGRGIPCVPTGGGTVQCLPPPRLPGSPPAVCPNPPP